MTRTSITKAGSTGVLAVAMALSVSLTGTGAATAASTTSAAPAVSTAAAEKEADRLGSMKAPVKGVAEDGRKVRGSFTPTEFTVVDGVMNVTGTLKGRFVGKGKPTSFTETITTPVQSVNGTALDAAATRGLAAPSAAAPAAAAPGACDILNLDLGPLNLDILGLQVNLQRVVLDIVAQSGAGNLLGNLLCAVAGLLDGPGAIAGLLGQISTLLNQILGLLRA